MFSLCSSFITYKAHNLECVILVVGLSDGLAPTELVP
jgi:hypothetical protein